MRILGIDPGLVNSGWGIIDCNNSKIDYIKSGTISTKSSDMLHIRLAKIVKTIEELLNNYEPNIVSMEKTFVNKNAVSSLKLAFTRGAIMSVIGMYEVDFYEYAPNQIKKNLVGAGHADKSQLNYMLNLLISNKPKKFKTSDESDALAVAYNCFADVGCNK